MKKDSVYSCTELNLIYSRLKVCGGKIARDCVTAPPPFCQLSSNMGPRMPIPGSLGKTTTSFVGDRKEDKSLTDLKRAPENRDMCFLILISGDIETNPGPPKGSPAKRVKPPTEKEIMEGRVTNHDERLAALEKLVKEQKVVIDSMTKTQVELKSALDDSKVEFEKSVEENKVVSTSLEELKVKMKRSVDTQVCTKGTQKFSYTTLIIFEFSFGYQM